MLAQQIYHVGEAAGAQTAFQSDLAEKATLHAARDIVSDPDQYSALQPDILPDIANTVGAYLDIFSRPPWKEVPFLTPKDSADKRTMLPGFWKGGGVEELFKDAYVHVQSTHRDSQRILLRADHVQQYIFRAIDEGHISTEDEEVHELAVELEEIPIRERETVYMELVTPYPVTAVCSTYMQVKVKDEENSPRRNKTILLAAFGGNEHARDFQVLGSQNPSFDEGSRVVSIARATYLDEAKDAYGEMDHYLPDDSESSQGIQEILEKINEGVLFMGEIANRGKEGGVTTAAARVIRNELKKHAQAIESIFPPEHCLYFTKIGSRLMPPKKFAEQMSVLANLDVPGFMYEPTELVIWDADTGKTMTADELNAIERSERLSRRLYQFVVIAGHKPNSIGATLRGVYNMMKTALRG